jgi:hypothetical protein
MGKQLQHYSLHIELYSLEGVGEKDSRGGIYKEETRY